MSSTRQIANEYIVFSVENEILYATFLNNVAIDLAAAKKILQDRIGFIQGMSFPILVDSTRVKSVNKEARDFLSSEEARTGVKATAILVSGYLSSAIANFFLKVTVKKPIVPTRIFSDKQKAITWLEQYK
jgi:hypothetical protein